MKLINATIYTYVLKKVDTPQARTQGFEKGGYI